MDSQPPAHAASMPAIEIDLTVVTYNSEPHLDILIASLAASSHGGLRVHLHVVDNCSQDGTVSRLTELLETHGGAFASTNIKESRQNLGFGRAHNQAVADGSAPYLFFLNPDAELPPNCLQRLIDAAEEADGDPQIAAWEPRQTPYEHPKIYDPVTMEPSWCSGAGLLFRREAFERIGGFDPRIFLYCEDVDISWRLKEAGYRLRYVPEATLVHNTYAEPGEVKPHQFVHSRVSGLYLRVRFGRWRDVVTGLFMYGTELTGKQHFQGQRRRLLRGLLSFARNFLYFRASGPRGRDRYRFHGWDYAVARGGAFHKVVPADDMVAHPKVSVLIRTVGRRPMLRRALSSVANQTYPNVEVVLVEDGPATLDEFLGAFPSLDLNYHALGRNRGRCEAGNEAMRLAVGEYFVFLDEDDEFFADHIEQLVNEICKSGKSVAYSTAFEVPTRYDTADNIVDEGAYNVVHQQQFSRLQLCQANYLPILAVMFHRSLFEQHGGFDPELDRLEDWDLWLRYAAGTDGFAFLDKTTSLYRVPIDYDREKDRRDEFGGFMALVRKKRSADTMTMTVGEIAADLDTTVGDNQNIRDALGLTSRELRTIYEIYRRIGVFRWGVDMVIFAIRKVTGR